MIDFKALLHNRVVSRVGLAIFGLGLSCVGVDLSYLADPSHLAMFLSAHNIHWSVVSIELMAKPIGVIATAVGGLALWFGKGPFATSPDKPIITK